jgi:hypothetical protein
LRKWQILNCPQTKTNKHLWLTIKFNANVEIVLRQSFGTHRHFVHCAQ